MIGEVILIMSLSEDQRVREHYFKKDKDFNEKIKQEMEEEEGQLNDYFKQYNKPVKEDPSVISTVQPR